MTSPTRAIDAFLDAIDIAHGPTDLLTRFIIKAITSAAARGVYLEFGTFSQLLEVNQLNQDSWRPLTTTLNADIGGARDDAGLVVLGRNSGGEVVATQAVRLFDWHDTNFKVEAESLRYFYERPASHKRPDERCTVTAGIAHDITGSVISAGGLWYRKDFRRRQLADIMPRLTRACAHALWGVDYLIAIVAEESVKKNLLKRVGMKDVSRSVVLFNSPGYPDSEVSMVLLRQTPNDLIDDVFNFMMSFDVEVVDTFHSRSA